jgi:hypothetical protein
VALRFAYSREGRVGQQQRTVRRRRPEAQGGGVAWPEEGDDLGGPVLRRMVGQLGRCEAFGPREEGGCGGLSWAKRPDGPGPTVGFVRKKSEKRERLTGGLPSIPGRNWFGLR